MSQFVSNVLLPPTLFLLLMAVGLLWPFRRPGLGRGLVGGALVLLWLLSTPFFSGMLLDHLSPPPVTIRGDEADAIVILGGGLVTGSHEYQGDTLKWISLERVRYGAWLARRLGKPVLVSGGMLEPAGRSEAEVMAEVLSREFRVRPRWLESRSKNTRENARNSHVLLEKSGIRRIYLVSHAWHLARAMPEFKRLGMVVVPAGTGYHAAETTLYSFLPSASGLMNAYFACHEMLGIVWYSLRHHFDVWTAKQGFASMSAPA